MDIFEETNLSTLKFKLKDFASLLLVHVLLAVRMCCCCWTVPASKSNVLACLFLVVLGGKLMLCGVYESESVPKFILSSSSITVLLLEGKGGG